jgi:xylulokinase
VLPYFAGERTPIFDPDARGVIAGLTLEHGRAELYRAALEGVAYGVRHNLEVMHEAGGRPGRLVAVGGGTQGGLWTRIVSEVTGAEQQVPTETVGACLGDALLAAVATGMDVDPETWNPADHTVRPDAAATERYDEFYRRYRELYPATADVAHFLAAEQYAADRG